VVTVVPVSVAAGTVFPASVVIANWTAESPFDARAALGAHPELRDEHDATILLCTHDMDEAEQLCDRIAVIDHGRMIELDTAENLKARVAAETGNPATTLEDVFIHLTGRSIEELDAPAESVA
jgi:ABC-2 type transport system ATP-binding protein